MKKVFVFVLVSLCLFSAWAEKKNAGVQTAGKTHGNEDSNTRFVYSEESIENYKEIFFSLDSARDYIFKNYDSYNSEDMKYFYKENYYWATTVVLVNNEISNNSRIKIGTAKKDVYDLLGTPWRIIRRENKDYFEYGYEDKINSISTSLGFYFDKNGFVSEIQIYKEYWQE